jgi:hypothetical protein
MNLSKEAAPNGRGFDLPTEAGVGCHSGTRCQVSGVREEKKAEY